MCEGMCWACGAAGAIFAYFLAEATPRSIDFSVEFFEGVVGRFRSVIEALEESFELRDIDADRAAFLGDDVVLGVLVDGDDARDFVLKIGAESLEVVLKFAKQGPERVGHCSAPRWSFSAP